MQVTRNGLPVSIYPAFEAEAGKKKKKKRNTFQNLFAPTQSGITPSIRKQC